MAEISGVRADGALGMYANPRCLEGDQRSHASVRHRCRSLLWCHRRMVGLAASLRLALAETPRSNGSCKIYEQVQVINGHRVRQGSELV